MKLVTVCTDEKGYFPVWKKMAEKNGFKTVVLGYKEKWQGGLWRTQKLLSYLRLQEKDEIILWSDAYDVLVLSEKDELMNKFNQLKCDVLFSCSNKNIGQPDHSWFYQKIYFPVIKSHFKCKNDYVINCGLIMGKCSVIITIFEKIQRRIMLTGIKDDQINLNSIKLDGINYRLDVDSTIFWIMEPQSVKEILHIFFTNSAPDYERNIRYDKGRVVFVKNNTTPCVVHGVSNRSLDKISTKNGYSVSQINKKDFSQEDIKLYLIFGKIGLFLIGVFLIMHLSKYLM